MCFERVIIGNSTFYGSFCGIIYLLICRSESDYNSLKRKEGRRHEEKLKSLFSFSDSEEDIRAETKATKATKPTEPKPKKPRKKSEPRARTGTINNTPEERATTSQSTAPPPTPVPIANFSTSLLSSDSEDEKEARRATAARKQSVLGSSFTRRVADGVLRRAAQLDGDTYIELRIYNSKDIVGVADWKERLDRASIAVKYQAHSDAPELGDLRNFLKEIKAKFTGEGKFYESKK